MSHIRYSAIDQAVRRLLQALDGEAQEPAALGMQDAPAEEQLVGLEVPRARAARPAHAGTAARDLSAGRGAE